MNNNDNIGSDLENPANPNIDDNASDESVNLDSGRPAVASAPGKIMIFVIAAIIFVAIVAKSLFFSDGGAPVENKMARSPEKVAAAESRPNLGIASAGELPTPSPQDPVTGFSSRVSSAYEGSAGGPGGSAPQFGRLSPTNTPGAGAAPKPAAVGAVAIPAPGVPSISPPVIAPPSLSSPVIPAIAAPTQTSSAGGVAVPPPPPPPALSSPQMPEVKTSLPRDEAAMQRLQKEMVVVAGPPPTKPGAGAKTASSGGVSYTGSDPNSQFANAVIAGSKAQSVTAERIDNLGNTIIEGKIIHSVLETAINSDLPGTIRGIVSHDVYAEAGRAILIPKGSRLLGTYNAAVKRGQNRVFIVWTRIVRPDGISIMVGSPGVDSLGRAGVEGYVDEKYFEMFSNALLTSSMTIGVAAIGEALFGDEQSSTTTNSGSGGSTTTTSPSGEAMREAVSTIGQVGKNIVGNVLGIQPTITIDQGTPVNVFVNKELIFPPDLSRTLISIN